MKNIALNIVKGSPFVLLLYVIWAKKLSTYLLLTIFLVVGFPWNIPGALFVGACVLMFELSPIWWFFWWLSVCSCILSFAFNVGYLITKITSKILNA